MERVLLAESKEIGGNLTLQRELGAIRRVKNGRRCKPISRVLYLERIEMVTIYLAPRNTSGPAQAGRRCRRGQAANPGTSRALIVPLFGLAPGGVWPPLRRRKRPGALTARFHPYPDSTSRSPGRYVSVPLSVPRAGTDPLRKPGRYPAPCPVEPGLSSPNSSLRSYRGGHPARSASFANLAQGLWRVKLTVDNRGTNRR